MTNPNHDNEIKEHKDNFGKAFLNWRKRNGLAQQNIHDFAKAFGSAGPYNSQVKFLEDGNLDPKVQFWFALETLNQELAKNYGK
tara:strand:+ start:349 stop:600 length:252 start_codon:yes stop_codon:yes gene_type:complete